MKKTCKNCDKTFEVFEKDQKFYNKIHVPYPSFCPICRRQRRQIFRNERNLYTRTCSLTGTKIVSVYSDNVPFPVYDHKIWHGDNWDATSYGKDFNFEKPFFEQFKELYDQVPRINFMNQASENSDYTNYAYRNKNCYLIFGSHYNEDCLYANYIWKDTNCIDCLEVIQSELVYEGICSDHCYQCAYIEYCFNCSDCYFCYDMIGCKNCMFSSNLRNKEYYCFNQPYSKEEYEKLVKKMDLATYSSLQKLYTDYQQIRAKAIKRDMFQKNCENCFGQDLQNSKNVYMGFNAKYAQDCNYIDTSATHVTDSMDLTCVGYDQSELLYECIGNAGNVRAMCCNSCWHSSEISYCEQCFDSKNLFGCIGLKHKQYWVLNKQYSKEEYENLVTKIIKHMGRETVSARRERETEQGEDIAGRSTERSELKNNEWGEFFPPSMSVFCYNETIAQIYAPLKEKEALEKGYKWKQKTSKEYQKQKYIVPDSIQDISDSITNEILACNANTGNKTMNGSQELCGKNYKIVPMELNFYKKMKIAIPRKCPDCRHQERVSLKTPRALWESKCSYCGIKITTSYPEGTLDTICCEKCYLQKVY